MNSLTRHGVEHLSASSLNCWRAAPALWTIRYLMRIKDQGNAAMWRGTAVEGGVEAIMRGRSLAEAKIAAQSNFEANAVGEASDEALTERATVPTYLDSVHATLRGSKATLIATQLRIELWLDDIPVPVIGYVDFITDQGLFDLKTTQRIPSVPRPDHARQVSIYMKARESAGALLYVSPKRVELYPIVNPDDHIASLRRDALSLMKFLDRFETARDAAMALPPDIDGFMWSDATKAKALELWTSQETSHVHATVE